MLNDLPDMAHLPEQDQQAIQDFAVYLREKAAAQRKYDIGQRVRIVKSDSLECGNLGTVYDYLPSRRWPYHVRPDGEFWRDGPGIAFTAEELEPIGDREEVKP